VKPSPRPRLDSIVTDKPIGSHPDIQDGDIIILEQALSEVRQALTQTLASQPTHLHSHADRARQVSPCTYEVIEYSALH